MKLGSTVNQFGDDRPALVHWIPTSALGGLEVALLTFLREAPELEHTIVTGEASGPMADLWRASGAKIIETPEWWEFLGISWASRWSGFVNSRPLSRLIIWSPTRLNLILRPLSPEIRCVVHLGSVGAFGFKARLFERMSALFNQSGCRPLLIACSVAAKKTAADEPILADYDCVVGYNAARPEYFALGSARQQQGRQRRMWGMVARMDEGKGQSLLLKAWALLPREFGLRLCLVGGGPREALLRQEAHELGLGGIVEFAGAVPDPSVIMRDWDAFVFATEAGEGFGIAVAEAMAAGLPCVVTDVPALREMAEDAAHYVRPHSAAVLAEAIMSVFKDPDLAADLSRKAKSRAEAQFTPSAFSNAYKEALGLLRT
jgi:glycosyltransferase involved in cell wall biosynthesis